eukprot:COSAG06_NODE_3938_length_4746_cov_2.077039_2_plen_121_part_00
MPFSKVNDRWGNDNPPIGSGKHFGGYFSGGDRQQAGPEMLKHKWENAFTIDSATWGCKSSPVLCCSAFETCWGILTVQPITRFSPVHSHAHVLVYRLLMGCMPSFFECFPYVCPEPVLAK